MRFCRVCFFLFATLFISYDALAQTTQRAISVTSVEAAGITTWQLTGRVQPRFTIPLSFRVSGKVLKRWVDVGERVQKGQVLAELDPADLQLARVQAKAKLGTAQADAKNAQRERKRLSRIYTNKLVSEQDLQRAQTSELAAQKNVIAAQAALTLAQRQLNYATLKAPASGILTQVNFDEAQVVKAGQPLIQLATGGEEAQVSIPTARLSLPLKQAVARGVSVPGQCQAILRTRNAMASVSSLDYQAFYTLKNCSQNLPLGTLVTLTYANKSKSTLQKVPIAAIAHLNGESFVWQVKAGQVIAQPVQVVRLDSQSAFIQSDLPLGTSIVSQGVHLLVNHQSVQVVP